MQLSRFLVLTAVVAGCTAAPVRDDAASDSADARSDATFDALADPIGRDATEVGPCSVDRDCDDGLFCNGAEACSPGAAGADTRGCVAASVPRCLPMQTCDEAIDRCNSPCDLAPDSDGDGARAESCGGDDCDDADRNRYPGNTEVCDARDHDEDCDPMTFGVRDADGDGYPDARCCNVGVGGRRACGDDCDDTRRIVHPTAPEACDTLDNDCNMQIDDGITSTFYRDADGDDFGTNAMSVMACRAPPGYVMTGGDCDDSNPGRNPGAPEVPCDEIDNDCDGSIGVDEDRDGQEACGRDCDDHRADRYAGAPELCDGVRNDCSRSAEPLDEDRDSDGYVDPGATCVGGPFAGPPFDCGSDRSRSRSPEAPERCNGIDDDCDLSIDEDIGGEMTRACIHAGSVAFGVTATCDSGACTARACAPGRTDCDADLSNGCSDLTTSGLHCGRCGNACPFACNGAGGCDAPVSLAAGYAPDATLALCVVTASGRAHCFRGNRRTERTGLVGVPEGFTVPITNVVQVAVGPRHACARRTDGTVWCWDFPGDETRASVLYPQWDALVGVDPVQIPRLTATVDISISELSTCAVDTAGRMCCWDGAARLFDDMQCRETSWARIQPGWWAYDPSVMRTRRVIPLLSRADVLCGTSAGGAFGCLRPDGSIFDTTHYRIPPGTYRVVGSRTSGSPSCVALVGSDVVRCFSDWGFDAPGDAPGYGTPVLDTRYGETTLAGVTSIVSVPSATCAIAAGDLQCWGRFPAPDGSTRTSLTPARVMSGVRAFDAISEWQMCAITNDGHVVCWGAASSSVARYPLTEYVVP